MAGRWVTRRVVATTGFRAHAAAYRCRIVSWISVCTSAGVGVGCALAGVFAGPRVPSRGDMDRALLAAAVATAGAYGWGFWRGQIAATVLPFVAATYLVGEWRARRPQRPQDPQRP